MRMALLGFLVLSGCGASSAARPAPPKFDGHGAKCDATHSVAEPLVVEWPSTARGRLESSLQSGRLIAVRHVGCDIEVLPQCTVEKAYAYRAFRSAKTDELVIEDTDRLHAKLPVGAVALEGKIDRGTSLHVDMRSVGRWELTVAGMTTSALKGICDGVTHVIGAATVGAFRFYSTAHLDAAGAATFAGAGGGAGSSSKREDLMSDGDTSACAIAREEDENPPKGCSAVIGIELMPMGGTMSATDVSGEWSLDYTSNGLPDGPPVHTGVFFLQRGSQLLGTYAGGGWYEGTIVGTHGAVFWTNGAKGRGEFDFAADASTFEGHWGGETGKLTSVHKGARIAKVTAPSAPGLDISGMWSTEYGGPPKSEKTTIHFVQSGNAVSGTYADGARYFGVLSNRTFTGLWRNQAAGRVALQFSDDGKSFVGNWGFGAGALTEPQSGAR